MSDNFPQTLFENIYRRAPTEADKNRLLNAKSGMGLSDNDELWPVIMTLDYYTSANLYARREILKAVEGLPEMVNKAVEGLPEMVKSTAEGIEAFFSEKADDAIANAVERGTEKLSQIVVKRSQITEDRISKRKLIVAASVGAVIAFSCLITGAGIGYLLTTSFSNICMTEAFDTTNGRIACFIE
jgi:hypothetical protein